MRIVEELTLWIKEQAEAAGAKGAVFGLSGGLDSTVVGALCERALGDRVLGVIMPCMSQSCDMDDALLAAEAFEIQTLTIDLSPVLQSLLAVLPAGGDAAVSNIKPRLRMITLYYLANDREMMVVGTSNKSERSVGYFTKHGDGAADICPLADIYKTELYEIAASLGVPRAILERPPSAGLCEGQTDEGELGMTYLELDSILKALERGRTPLEMPDTVARVKGLVSASEHKRASVPAFGVPGEASPEQGPGG
jgi:NAD+ synthase